MRKTTKPDTNVMKDAKAIKRLMRTGLSFEQCWLQINPKRTDDRYKSWVTNSLQHISDK